MRPNPSGIMEVAEMKSIKVTLCEHCSECPEVEITDEGVSIGEDEKHRQAVTR
jgi:hypothetical protein